ncbi:hypothetical protein EV686_1031 [Paracandidimonas soli]|uniref:Uncharacterized protein n=1 Tax=Paracandidimonas soli TaxID=1917182 RepID=A0A4R3V8Z1_9BURK|nr:hypothetical protein EV686_1031 [Paracandidimonas soli]
MTYQFHIDGEIYIGETIPGAARMRIFHPRTDRFVVAFDPDVHSLRGNRPSGSWANIQPHTDLALLETLEAQVLSACRARLRNYDEANGRTHRI